MIMNNDVVNLYHYCILTACGGETISGYKNEQALGRRKKGQRQAHANPKENTPAAHPNAGRERTVQRESLRMFQVDHNTRNLKPKQRVQGLRVSMAQLTTVVMEEKGTSQSSRHNPAQNDNAVHILSAFRLVRNFQDGHLQGCQNSQKRRRMQERGLSLIQQRQMFTAVLRVKQGCTLLSHSHQ